MSDTYLFTKSELDASLRHQFHTQVQKEVDAISEEHFKATSSDDLVEHISVEKGQEKKKSRAF